MIEYWEFFPPMFQPTSPPDWIVDWQRPRLTAGKSTDGWLLAYGMHPVQSLPSSWTVKVVFLEYGGMLGIGVARTKTLTEVTNLTLSDSCVERRCYMTTIGYYSGQMGGAVRFTVDLPSDQLHINVQNESVSESVSKRLTCLTVPNLGQCFICIAADRSGTTVELA